MWESRTPVTRTQRLFRRGFIFSKLFLLTSVMQISEQGSWTFGQRR